MSIAQYGRYGDTEVAHVAKGELIVPKEVLDKRPDLRQEIYKEIEKYGVKGERYVVGSKYNSINPHTGHPEFFLKKILPVIGGAVGFAVGGPMGASIGAGLGAAARGDNPVNIATSALMGYGLGSFGQAAGLVGGQGVSALGTSAKAMVSPQAVINPELAGQTGVQQMVTPQKVSALSKMAQFAKENKLLTGALGLGALGAMGAFKEEDKGTSMTPPPEPGSQGMLDITPGAVTYYDPKTRAYGAASPQIPEIYRAAEGGFPRKTGQIDGPGTEKSDDIPAMLSDGEFVMTAKAVRGLGALNGANKDDKLEQRRKGAKMMYEMMDKFESKVA